MSSILKEFSKNTIEREIQLHPAWLGQISGLKADKLLRGRKQSYLYILRAGEHANDYYVSFTLPDLSIKHQPFIIKITPQGWCYENSGGGGPYMDASIEDVLHLIMHCHKDECVPLILT